MRATWQIFRRELGAFFTSPMAYVVMTLFLIIMGFFFFVLTSRFTQSFGEMMMWAQMQGMPPDFNFNANEMILEPLFYQAAVVLLFLAPMLTMRLFAEENQLGTVELLLTCPVRDIEVILGKFLASLTVVAVMFALTLVYPIFTAYQTSLEIGPILTGYIGLLLLASAFLAVGIFYSSLTENQIVAGALTFATLLALWLIAALVQTDAVTGGLQSFLTETSIILRYEDFARGVINLGDGLYYLTITALGLFLTVNVLDSKVH
ncbi:ABC transporter permease subunit [Candidatus Sumerlaeota bacterium]|nr:ABC transporter permease subunit [Candidatus Sumerlaeota bacterium]